MTSQNIQSELQATDLFFMISQVSLIKHLLSFPRIISFYLRLVFLSKHGFLQDKYDKH